MSEKRVKDKKGQAYLFYRYTKRNFTHIDDIMDGLVLVGENGYGDEFGIGSDEAFSVL